MKPRHLIPNAVTLANIALGVLGIVSAAEGHFQRAILFLFAGALCDLADGRLARALGATSHFGKELDSLSDMVSFGVAPAVLVYLAVLSPLGIGGAVIAVLFPLAGAVRLARYNLDNSEGAEHSFQGLPIPIAASYIWSFVIMRGAMSDWMVAAGVVLIATLMVSTVKVPKFRRGGLPVGLMFLGLGAFIAFLARPSSLTWHVWNTFNLVMVALNYVVLRRRAGTPPADPLPEGN